MKLLINLLAAGALVLPANLVFAEHQPGHEGHSSNTKGDCCDQEDCCKDCDHKDGKHSCCGDKAKAEECCKDCKDKKCKKACKTGNCKKGHCELKKPNKKPNQSTPAGT